MCSRQERIQKDIDIVIQKSRAEKDCLFAGEFLPPGSWDPEPAFPPATPLPRFLTATLAAWGGCGECGAASPRSGCIWKQLQRRELEPQGGGGHAPPLPRPPALTGQGSLGLWGQQNPRGRSAGAGRWIPATGAAQSILPALAAAAEQAGLRHRPNGGGREGTGCAALRCSARRHRGPGRRQRWAELPPPCLHPLLDKRTHSAPGTEWIPGAPELRRPSLGVPSRPSLLPRGREQFGLRSPKPGWGCFRPPGWEIPAVAMAPGTCCGGQTPAAPRGVLGIPSRTVAVPTPCSLALYPLLIGPPWLR